MSLRPTTQAKLKVLENDWLAAERAVLEHVDDPKMPPCEVACARKAVERLEEKRCQAGTKPQLTMSTED